MASFGFQVELKCDVGLFFSERGWKFRSIRRLEGVFSGIANQTLDKLHVSDVDGNAKEVIYLVLNVFYLVLWFRNSNPSCLDMV